MDKWKSLILLFIVFLWRYTMNMGTKVLIYFKLQEKQGLELTVGNIDFEVNHICNASLSNFVLFKKIQLKLRLNK